MITLILSFYVSIISASQLRGSIIQVKQYIEQTQSIICYGVQHDAGSSGTRVYVYQWPCRQSQTINLVNISVTNPSKKNSSASLASFASHLYDLEEYLDQFIQFAKQNIPQNQWGFTPIMLGATAGMRIIPLEDQYQIMKIVRHVFAQSGFLFLDNEWARVITGEEEGASMWLSTNYLLDLLDPFIPASNTSLTIDLGGASTQISFKPYQQDQNSEKIMKVSIPNFNQYEIYSTTYLYYGNDQARQIIIKQNIDISSNIIYTPCYHQGYEGKWESDNSYTIKGTGQEDICRQQIRTYLNADQSNCNRLDHNCAINGKYQPSIPSGALVYGMSGVNNAADFLDLQDFYLPDFLQKAQVFSSLTWSQIQADPVYSKNPYSSTNYFLTLYVYELLATGYKITEDTLIHSPNLIQQNTPTWALGAIMFAVSQISCQYDSPYCSNFRI